MLLQFSSCIVDTDLTRTGVCALPGVVSSVAGRRARTQMHHDPEHQHVRSRTIVGRILVPNDTTCASGFMRTSVLEIREHNYFLLLGLVGGSTPSL